MGNGYNRSVRDPLFLPSLSYDEDADEVSSSTEQRYQGSEATEQQRYYTDMSVAFHSLSLSPSWRVFPSFSSPRSLVISLSAFPMPLFIEQAVLLRLSMKLCVCEPAKRSKSHSSVRHSSYTPPSDNSKGTWEEEVEGEGGEEGSGGVLLNSSCLLD